VKTLKIILVSILIIGFSLCTVSAETTSKEMDKKVERLVQFRDHILALIHAHSNVRMSAVDACVEMWLNNQIVTATIDFVMLANLVISREKMINRRDRAEVTKSIHDNANIFIVTLDDTLLRYREVTSGITDGDIKSYA
jgi:hypothetical protein